MLHSQEYLWPSNSQKYDPHMAQNIYGPPMANKHFNVKFDLFWIHLIYFEPHWAILNRFDQVWTSLYILNRFDQVWTSLSILNKFD